VALGATVAGLFAAVVMVAPASAAPFSSAPAASNAELVNAAGARDEDDCRVSVDRRRDSASAFCWDQDRGDEVTLKLRCERGRFRYLAEESERVRRGDRVRLSVRCRRGFDAGRAWVEVDERGRGRG
jgi:hypothetical protein